mgnify:CR=1 FL=1
MAKLVKMVNGDKTADVHPDEVDNYKSGNWVVVEPKKRQKRVSKTESK